MPIYEYQCNECGRISSEYAALPHDKMSRCCAKCKGPAERIYSLSAVKVFETFTTTNILPEGEPVTVRGTGQLRQLEAEHKVKMADGPPPQTSFAEPS